MFLSDTTLVKKVKAATSSGTTAVNSDAVDLSADGGWDGVLFLSTFGTANAGNKLKAQSSTDNSAWSDLAGSAIVPAGTAEAVQGVDLFQPTGRYVRCVATRAEASTLGEVYALLYRGRSVPADNVVADTINVTRLAQPVNGTA
jgi:hypothetical protein